MKEEEGCCVNVWREIGRQAHGGNEELPGAWATTENVIGVTGRRVLAISSGQRREKRLLPNYHFKLEAMHFHKLPSRLVGIRSS